MSENVKFMSGLSFIMDAFDVIKGRKRKELTMTRSLKFSAKLSASDPQTTPVRIIGQIRNLNKIVYDDVKMKLEPVVTAEMYSTALASLRPSPTDSCPLWLNMASIAALPTQCSRHNTPSRAHALTKLVKSSLTGRKEFIVMVCERRDVLASACAIARALPEYSCKASCTNSVSQSVTVEFILVGNECETPLAASDLDCLQTVTSGIRLAARLVDAPCSEMHTDAFVDEISKIGAELNITPLIIRGNELAEKGFGGVYNVGKAASHPPALVVLSHKPEKATYNICWVGKGIVYDTGGLCIKSKATMLGMKRDCGGAAAILGAFYSTVKLGFTENLHAIFCLAENAISPDALRPDDIINMYSGRTVEVNNTDAEGRLVLSDGVAYAQKDLKADIVIDVATLTGAQGVATGRFHAGIVTNNENWENACLKAGRVSGDLVHAMPYTPELHFVEFSSALADMKNSVADRSNAQVSCAGLFIASSLGFDYSGIWLHIDMAFPVYSGERATGYGVALLATLLGEGSSNSMLQYVAPPLVENSMDIEENEVKRIRLE
ncbi:probable aminopeptidase NPEPL1 isoform X1 [Octopus sinensis]|uniref:Probable aminopeptidase NPEPL1 isoform X1 n=2 Tax=Octopus sinensis TaxID=2607531 RepID=A0A6P7TKE4_9MOLL|nr:probable aminopeptidase NPEPL1 isoform X1 [Octopus sinensis]